jgi:hypothetical protein
LQNFPILASTAKRLSGPKRVTQLEFYQLYV